MIYLNRFKNHKQNKKVIFDYNIFYLFILSFVLSIKYNIDNINIIKFRDLIFKIFDLELNNNYYLFENNILKKLKYDLYISKEQYLEYYKIIK